MLIGLLVAEAGAFYANRVAAETAPGRQPWAAFRASATEDTDAQLPHGPRGGWLKDRADPGEMALRHVAESYVACDGRMKIDTGFTRTPRGDFGFFVTVWHRAPDGGWQSHLDLSDALVSPQSVPRRPLARQAACPATPIPLRIIGYRHGGGGDERSPDGTVQYHWWNPGFDFRVEIWDGKVFETVIRHRMPPAPQQ